MFRRVWWMSLAFLGLVAVPVAPTAAAENGVDVKLDKLHAATPANWTPEKTANRLRSYQFRLKGESGDAELIVMPESHPNPEKVFPRWKASFVPPEGKTTDDISKESKQEIAGATVHILDASGTWRYKERPFDPRSKQELRDNYRVIWIIVAEKDEATHLRLSGPQATVAKYWPGVETWLKSLR